MHKLEELKEMLMRELEVLAMSDQLSTSALEKIHKLTDTIKNIDKITMLEEGEYSERGGSYRGGSSRRGGSSYEGGSYGGSYEGGSYARRRDGRGRYSRAEDRRYSREGKEDMIEQIEELMENAQTEKERQAYQRCLNALQNA